MRQLDGASPVVVVRPGLAEEQDVWNRKTIHVVVFDAMTIE
jgi:hypothetical protein